MAEHDSEPEVPASTINRRALLVGALGVAGLGGLVALSRTTGEEQVSVRGAENSEANPSEPTEADPSEAVPSDADPSEVETSVAETETTLEKSSGPTSTTIPEIAVGRASNGPFAGLTVADFPRTPPGPGVASRLHIYWDSKVDFAQLVADLAVHEGAASLEGIVIGSWIGDLLDSPSIAIDPLIANAKSFPALRALYFGDIASEWSEISWVECGDQAALANAFPNLEVLHIRGNGSQKMAGLSLPKLRSLTLESGGLNPQAVRDVLAAPLPALEHLELWLGTPDYGGETRVADLAPLLNNTAHPNLKYVGLRNSEIADDLAKAVANSPRLQTVTDLDLSLGTMTADGFRALAVMEPSPTLKRLNVSHHYASPDAVADLQRAMQQRNVEVDTSNAIQPDDEDYRYVSISE